MILEKVIDFIKKDNKRSIKNYLINPREQLKLAFLITFQTLVAVAGACYFVYNMHYPLFESLIIVTGEVSDDNFQLLSDNTFATIKIISMFAALYVFMMSAVIVWYSHRFVGPEVAFRHHAKALTEGKTSARIRLRKGDAFKDLAGDLNKLAETLDEKTQSKKSQAV